MKKLTTIFCSVCFLIMGFVLSQNKSSESLIVSTMNAAEPNNSILPSLRNMPMNSEMNQGNKAVPDTIMDMIQYM